ncbi:hypothetical protein bcgnr5397_51810 [Bacillus luti]
MPYSLFIKVLKLFPYKWKRFRGVNLIKIGGVRNGAKFKCGKNTKHEWIKSKSKTVRNER